MVKKIKPFTKAYILRRTTRYMRRAIGISIRETFTRVKDFDGDQQKSQEVFETLSFLHTMRKMLDDFQAHNSDAFKGK